MPIFVYCSRIAVEMGEWMTKSFVFRIGYLDGESQKFGHKIQFKRRNNFRLKFNRSTSLLKRIHFSYEKRILLSFRDSVKSCECSSYLMLISYLLCLLLLLDIIICRYCFVVTFSNSIFSLVRFLFGPWRLCIVVDLFKDTISV